jgi:hypothetical protein
MSGDANRCPVCGTRRSEWLEGNCPGCLMHLAETKPTLPLAPDLRQAGSQTNPSIEPQADDPPAAT